MKDRRAQYVEVDNVVDETSLVIRDVGPWDRHFTVTNDAENVVADLAARGLLPDGRRLFYYDSAGTLDEIVHEGGRFVGFAPGPRDARRPTLDDGRIGG